MAGEQQIANEIRQISAADELGESFLPYSLSVITSRALPDVRDGLKPVQRRIIVAMNDLLMRPGSPHRKSAKVVGDTMGNYHPHGDSAIYEAMVRMGQTFSMSVPLIDPHGNFGTLDDPPAASRYTECRLTTAAMEMIGELAEETVDYRPTYDGENEEPEYLPSRMPNLLVNGSSGIAVGMATNMAPHNLSEVCELLELIMTKRRPKPTVDELMEVLPGPDFPTGGVIIDDGGIRQAYETGRGIVRMRAVAEIAQITPRRNGIIVTELPYNVGPERVIKRVQELVRTEKLNGIHDFKNLSDKNHGMRLQIECKTGVNPRAVLADLYRLTPMEETFGINNVVLVDGRPTTVSLYDLGRLWIEHRIDVVIRRTEFRLAKAEARAHIVEGLLIALDAIDLVVSIIRTSSDTATARGRLMEQLNLSEIQAESILEMPLRRLTELANLELTAELEELQGHIAEYDKILMSEQRRRTIVLNEIRDVAEMLGGPRRTKIVHEDEAPVFLPDEPISTAADVDAEPCIITLSSSGLVGREQADGSRNGKLGRHDVLVGEAVTNTTSLVRAITSTGRVLTVQAAEIPAVAGRSRGASARELFAVTRGEDVLGVFADIGPDGEGPASTDPIVLVTKAGVAKRVSFDELTATATGMSVIKLKDRDTLIGAFSCPEDGDVAMVSADAQILRTAASGISVQGRNASGVAGMKLREGSDLIMAARVHPEGVLLTTTDADTTKLTPLEEIPAKGRGGGGVRITRFRDFETQLWHAYLSPTRRVVAVVGTEETPSKPDSDPIDLDVEITKRDAVSADIGRRVLVGGKARW